MNIVTRNRRPPDERAADDGPLIFVEGLAFSFPDSPFRLEVQNLNICRGEAVAFVGPSGSGKTTLLNLLAGIYAPQRGTIRIGQVTVSDLRDAARRSFRIANIGLVFQDFRLVTYLNVLENIVLPYRINRRLKLTSAVRQAAESLAESMGLADKLGRPINRLSQGERQRVAICRALLPGPGLLLADEPTGNLDPQNKRLIMQILRDRAAATDATLIVVTHDQTLLADFDRVIDFARFQCVADAGAGADSDADDLADAGTTANAAADPRPRGE